MFCKQEVDEHHSMLFLKTATTLSQSHCPTDSIWLIIGPSQHTLEHFFQYRFKHHALENSSYFIYLFIFLNMQYFCAAVCGADSYINWLSSLSSGIPKKHNT